MVLDAVDGLASSLRRPEYTGENRCAPCTVVNLCLAVLAGLGVGAVVRAATTRSGVVAALVVVLWGSALVYLRGYLVPGTPTLTKRYLPAPVLAAFGKDPPETGPTAPDGGPVVDPADPAADESFEQEAVLLETGALEVTPDGADLVLADGFRTDWYEEIDRADTEADYDGLLRVLHRDDGPVDIEVHGGSCQAQIDGDFVGVWKSRAAFLADVAGATTLAERYEPWDDLAPGERTQLLSGLRLFLDRCPACGGEPVLATETVETCCAAQDVAALDCAACDARLFETEA
jgi:hypothetical protein